MKSSIVHKFRGKAGSRVPEIAHFVECSDRSESAGALHRKDIMTNNIKITPATDEQNVLNRRVLDALADLVLAGLESLKPQTREIVEDGFHRDLASFRFSIHWTTTSAECLVFLQTREGLSREPLFGFRFDDATAAGTNGMVN